MTGIYTMIGKRTENEKLLISTATSAGRVLNVSKHSPDSIFIEKYGEKWVNYRNRWTNASSGALEPFPLFVRIESQFKCNSNCTLCVHGHEELKRDIGYDEIMSLDTFKNLVDECRKHDCPSIGISFINEPLLDVDFAQRLSYVGESGIMDIHFNSNAQLLTREISELIIQNNVTRACFSIDAATPETFRKMRPNLDYDTVVHNIEMFIALRNSLLKKLPLVRVSFLLNEINAKEQEDFKKIWAEKADYVSFQRYVPISIHNDNLGRAIQEVPIVGEQKCSYPWESLFVHGDGVVVPCAAHRGRFISVGNIRENTLEEIWHSESINALRNALKSGELKRTTLCYSCLN
jgi:radical SAM protein with 4Fe4S-binding SPASM domain